MVSASTLENFEGLPPVEHRGASYIVERVSGVAMASLANPNMNRSTKAGLSTGLPLRFP